MPELIKKSEFNPDFDIDCLVIGAGAAGLTSALAAHHRQRSVIVIERDGQLSGSTALSSGFIPAAETHAQKAQGINDSLDQFCDDISLRKTIIALTWIIFGYALSPGKELWIG